MLRVTSKHLLPGVLDDAYMHFVFISLHCALSLVVQCIVISPVCVFAMGGWAGVVCVWVCYHK